jgi:hypothetical protein
MAFPRRLWATSLLRHAARCLLSAAAPGSWCCSTSCRCCRAETARLTAADEAGSSHIKSFMAVSPIHHRIRMMVIKLKHTWCTVLPLHGLPACVTKAAPAAFAAAKAWVSFASRRCAAGISAGSCCSSPDCCSCCDRGSDRVFPFLPRRMIVMRLPSNQAAPWQPIACCSDSSGPQQAEASCCGTCTVTEWQE